MGITYRRPARPVTSTDVPRPPLRTYGATVRPCELSISSVLATKHMSVVRSEVEHAPQPREASDLACHPPCGRSASNGPSILYRQPGTEAEGTVNDVFPGRLIVWRHEGPSMHHHEEGRGRKERKRGGPL